MSSVATLDSWVETAKKCKYLPEPDLKKLCELVLLCKFILVILPTVY